MSFPTVFTLDICNNCPIILTDVLRKNQNPTMTNMALILFKGRTAYEPAFQKKKNKFELWGSILDKHEVAWIYNEISSSFISLFDNLVDFYCSLNYRAYNNNNNRYESVNERAVLLLIDDTK